MLVDRQVAKGEAVATSLNELGTRTMFIEADCRPRAGISCHPRADAAFGRIDILANIAGLTDRGTIVDTDLDLFDKMFAINVRAPFF